MKSKVDSLKEIRERVRNLNPEDRNFSDELFSQSERTIRILEEVNDQQEKNWVKKSQEILSKTKTTEDTYSQDQALSYLLEALNSVILREENFLK